MLLPGNWFQEWFNSPYYYQLYCDRNEAEALSFINLLLDHLHPSPDSLMLDVACGMGRHSKILAAKGFDVTGIDLSPNSIKQALLSANDHLHFYEHDMRRPFRINYFNYAFNFFTSFGYFNTAREHNNAMRTMGQSLVKHGELVVDYLNVHYAENNLIHKSEKDIDGVRFYLTKWFDETHFYKKIFIEDDSKDEPVEFVERVAKLSVGDFNELFAYNGLQLQEVYGDYAFNTYDMNLSPRLLMVAKKI